MGNISARTRLENAARSGLRPDPVLSVSQWADTHRVLTSVASGQSGRWRTARTPYLGEIMDRLSAWDPCQRVVLMKGGQIGGTEAGNNWLGYCIHHSPGPILVVQPTVEMAKRWSKGRLAPLLEGTPALRDRVRDPRTRDSGNTIQSKEFSGGILIITGANSAVGLRSIPVQRLFLDEIDGYPGDVDNEGDPVDLAVMRTATYRSRRKIFLVSTPTYKGGSRIETAYEESDKRRYFVPCPNCGNYQVLDWSQVRWPEGRPRGAYYVCADCEGRIENHQKTTMLARGEWRPTAEGDGETAGYHVSSLYSPHGWLSWGDIAEEFMKAKADPPRLKVWVNTKLGQTWEDRDGERVDETGLMARREAWGPPDADSGVRRLPGPVEVLTAGVDTQADRLEVEIVGWGAGYESWSVDYRVIWGDPSAQAVWRDLDALLQVIYAHAEKPGGIRVAAGCVDTGGQHTMSAYAYCRRQEAQRRRIWAIKGRSAPGQLIWPRKPSRTEKGKVNLFVVGVDQCKEDIYSRLRVADPGPGYCHFPPERDADYFTQLTVERRRVKFHRGHRTAFWWKPDGARNEALDCRVYAYAALHSLLAGGKRLGRPDGPPAGKTRKPKPEESVSQAPQEQPSAPRPRSPRSTGGDWFGPPRRGWL